MDKQQQTINVWNKYYQDHEKNGPLGNEYPKEELVRFVSNLRKPTSEKDYFDDRGKECFLKRKFSGNALEFGFGTTANLRMLDDKGFKAYGLEVSEEAVEYGKADLQKRGRNGIELTAWKPTKLPQRNY